MKSHSPSRIEGEIVKDEISPASLAKCSTPEARKMVTLEDCHRFCVLPLSLLTFRGETFLTLAAREKSGELDMSFRFITGGRCKFIIFSEEVVKEALFLAYNSGSQKLEEAILKLPSENRTEPGLDSSIVQQPSSPAKENIPEMELLKVLIEYAFAQHASDLHIIPRKEKCYVRMRLKSGEITRERELCSLQVHDRITRRLKLMAKLDLTQTEIAHDGNIHIPILDKTVHARLSVIPTLFGEKSVLRFISNDTIPEFHALGYIRKIEEKILQVAESERGLTLLCGSTGSGKTTSLYSILKLQSESGKNIISVEDPAECIVDWMSQTQVSREGKLTYPSVLKAFLRQDPDIILVGEMRDAETIDLAVQAALTGHTIYSSFHAGSIQDALIRLQGSVANPEAIYQSLSLIVHQKLHNRLCNVCKRVNPLVSEKIGFNVYQGIGCPTCNMTGYNGKLAVAELLHISSHAKELLQRRTPLQEIFEELRGDDYIALEDSYRELVQLGIVGRGIFR